MRRRLSSVLQLDVLKRLSPYAKGHRVAMAMATLLALAASAVGLAAPWALKILVDNGLSQKPLPSWMQSIPLLNGATPKGIVIFAVVLGVTLMLLSDVIDVLGRYLNERIHDALVAAFKCDLFGHLQRLSLSYHDRSSVGDSMYRLDKDTWFIATLLWDNPRELVVSLVTLLDRKSTRLNSSH